METTYDVIVVGGGPAGTGAALAAAENGAHVLLLEGTGRLGGMAVQALVGPFLGGIRSSVVQKILKAMGGRTVDFAQMDVQLYDVLTAAGVTILLHAPVVDIIKEEKQVKGVVVHAAGRKLTFTAKAVIDATGNGDVAYMAGIPYESGREGDHLLQPMSIMYIINGIDPERRFLCGSEEEARRKTVGGRTWEDIVTEAQHNGELPPSVGVIRLYAGSLPSRAIVNATQINGVDGVEPVDLTKAEIDGRRQAFQIVEFLRRKLPGFENVYAELMPSSIGVRETRRFEGCARLEKEDCIRGAQFPDAVVFDANFCIDIHNPAGSGQAVGHDETKQGQAESCRPYQIPYRCLLPKHVDGLLMAGRCISASHEAHASLRVMCIGMAIGAGAGAAAAWAVSHNCQLRDVDASQLAEYLK